MQLWRFLTSVSRALATCGAFQSLKNQTSQSSEEENLMLISGQGETEWRERETWCATPHTPKRPKPIYLALFTLYNLVEAPSRQKTP